MIYVGIDVAKDKHDCIIIDSFGETLASCFTIPNCQAGFLQLYNTIISFTSDVNSIKIGLEATGHYSNNILAFLHKHHLQVYLLNPLQTCLYRKVKALERQRLIESMLL